MCVSSMGIQDVVLLSTLLSEISYLKKCKWKSSFSHSHPFKALYPLLYDLYRNIAFNFGYSMIYYVYVYSLGNDKYHI